MAKQAHPFFSKKKQLNHNILYAIFHITIAKRNKMNGKRIKVYHIVRDQKFFDGPIQRFDEDGRFENECFLIVDNPNYEFKWIKNSSRVKLLYNKQMIKETLKGDYDAVFFFSLPDYHIFSYIPKDKIIIWWAWGYDIYGQDRFISINLYKPLTQRYIDSHHTSIITIIREKLKNIPFLLDLKHGSRNSAIKRIDYFQPVINYEFELMKGVNGFRAKEFYYPGSQPDYSVSRIAPHKREGDIIIGNSASVTNNHLDIWERVKTHIPSKTTVVFPINYGDKAYGDYLEKEIGGANYNLTFIKEYMPRDDFFNMVDSCSYAIIGVIREQAMGLVNRCMGKGIKLFLYENSVLFKYLTNIGCVVFSIESIDENSFQTPLSEDLVLRNQKALRDVCKECNRIGDQAIDEILGIVNSRHQQ